MLALGQKQPFQAGQIIYSYNDRSQRYAPFRVEECKWNTKYSEFVVSIRGVRNTEEYFPNVSIKTFITKLELFTRKVDLIPNQI